MPRDTVVVGLDQPCPADSGLCHADALDAACGAEHADAAANGSESRCPSPGG